MVLLVLVDWRPRLLFSWARVKGLFSFGWKLLLSSLIETVYNNLRTLVIGTPSGEMGFILNRDGRLPADRLAAAREILEWNGYDLERLQTF